MYKLVVTEVRVYCSKETDHPIVSSANEEVANGKNLLSFAQALGEWLRSMKASVVEYDLNEELMYVKVDLTGLVMECELLKTDGKITKEEITELGVCLSALKGY